MTDHASVQTETVARLSWRQHVVATVLLGLPLVGAQLAQMAINVTDTVMLGWLGATELAAGVLATQVFFIVYMVGTGFALAMMPLAAAAEGQGHHEGLRRSIRMGLWVLGSYSLIVMVPLWFTEDLLLILKQEPDNARLAGDYMRVAQWSMLPALIVMGFRSYLSVVGRAHVVLWAIVFGALFNAIFNYAFIFGEFGAPALGMVGAALGSLLTNSVMALGLVIYTNSSRALKIYDLYHEFWNPVWRVSSEIVRIGWPISTTLIAEVGLFTASSFMIGWLGTIELASHGVALQLASIAFMIPLGLSSAATVRVGAAYGRGHWREVRRAGFAALGVAIAVAFCTASLFLGIPTLLIKLYLDETNPQAFEILSYATPLLAVAAAFQIVDGLQAVVGGVLRGLKDTKIPMLMAVVSYWLVGMPVAYTLGFVLKWGGVGVWWGLAVGLLTAAILMNWRFIRSGPMT